MDVRNKLLFKQVCSKSNYPALIYYMIDEHMYPVINSKTRIHITRKFADNHTMDSLLQKEYDDSAVVERFTLPFFEDVPLEELGKYKDCNIFYHTGNLHDKLITLFKTKNTQYK